VAHPSVGEEGAGEASEAALPALKERFRAAFGPARATHLVRAPGRVNLIGEHTDYNGLPVMPVAIQRRVAILFRARDDTLVRLANVDPAYPPRELELSASIDPFAQGDWGNYAKAAAQAMVERFGIRRGIDGAVSGDIPPAAGLSSSSAMVVATALALLEANEVEIDRAVLMDLLPRAERYVGTQSGGMDQAICLGGRRGHAVVIGFRPLRLRPTPLPSDWRFVVANTLVRAQKSGDALAAYNARTVECREALRRLRDHPRAEGLPRTYLELVQKVPQGALLDLAGVLPEPLCRRFRHVVTEGARVEDARAAMLEGDLAAFGRLMNVSHESLRVDYEVSCVELDELVGVAREHGAAGARLTGAGFGGCAVALTRVAHVERLLAGLEEDYYRRRGVDARAADALLLAEPSDGARVITL
jgi:galactokinase